MKTKAASLAVLLEGLMALPAAAQSPPPQPYRDQVIDEKAAAEPDTAAGDPLSGDELGRRGLSVTLMHESRSVRGQGRSDIDGVSLSHFRETEQYGDLIFDASFGHSRPASFDLFRERDRFRATLYHNNFALDATHTLSSAVGVVRSYLPPWQATSYRISFPTSEMAGITTVLTSADRELHASYGALGNSFGSLVQGFERTSGHLASMGISQRVGTAWQAGATVLSVSGAQLIRDHTSLLLSAATERGRSSDFLKLQAGADDEGHVGGLIDAQLRLDRWLHRAGVYQFERGFAFGDSSGQSDVRGAYWRGETRSAGNYTGLGAEYNASNLRRDPTLGGLESASVYGNLSLRLDRTLQVGGGLNLRDERPVAGPAEPRRVMIANAYLSRMGGIGNSRFDVSYNALRPRRAAGESIRTYSWNQDWPRFSGIESNTLVTYSQELGAEGTTRRASASVGLRGPLGRNLNWSANATWVDVRGPESTERNYNTSVDLDWQFAPSWTLHLQWLRNQVQATAPDTTLPFIRENTVQLVARWSETRGISYGGFGGSGVRSASGRIEGLVYFDENGDGVQQPTERGVPSVVLTINGRISQVTDRDGRFTFPLLPPGSYLLAVLPERVPLPWGLADDTPRSVVVGVRQDTRLEIGLTRIGQ